MENNSKVFLEVLIPINDFDTDLLEPLSLVCLEEQQKGNGHDNISRGPEQKGDEGLDKEAYPWLFSKNAA